MKIRSVAHNNRRKAFEVRTSAKTFLFPFAKVDPQQRVKASPLSKREIIRRIGTSATQFYRLLDQRNHRNSVDQLLSLLHVLDCDIDFVVRSKSA